MVILYLEILSKWPYFRAWEVCWLRSDKIRSKNETFIDIDKGSFTKHFFILIRNLISRKGARMDLTNVVIAIVVVLLVLSFRWFLRKFCDTLNWNTRFISHTSDSNTTTINSSQQVRTVYTIEVNSLKTKESKAHSLSKNFCSMIPFSKNDHYVLRALKTSRSCSRRQT